MCDGNISAHSCRLISTLLIQLSQFFMPAERHTDAKIQFVIRLNLRLDLLTLATFSAITPVAAMLKSGDTHNLWRRSYPMAHTTIAFGSEAILYARFDPALYSLGLHPIASRSNAPGLVLCDPSRVDFVIAKLVGLVTQSKCFFGESNRLVDHSRHCCNTCGQCSWNTIEI